MLVVFFWLFNSLEFSGGNLMYSVESIHSKLFPHLSNPAICCACSSTPPKSAGCEKASKKTYFSPNKNNKKIIIKKKRVVGGEGVNNGKVSLLSLKAESYLKSLFFG